MSAEKNKIIAKFMDYKTGKQLNKEYWPTDFFAPDGTRYVHLNFDENWNLLMRLVEKIEKLGYYTKGYSLNNGKSFRFYIIKTGQEKPLIKSEIGKKIDTIYQSCVDFINWYNEQNK